MNSRQLAILTVAIALVASGCSGASTSTPVSTPRPTATAAATATPTAPTQTPVPTPTAPPTIGVPADDGARIIAVESPTTLQHTAWVSPGAPGCPADPPSICLVDVGSPISTARIRDLTVDSPMVGTTHVRLFLPKHFAAQPSTRWAALYLLRGGSGDYKRWSELQDVTTLAGPTDLLVVMPDSGYTPDGPGPIVAWYKFHLVELPQLLERNWLADDRRAIAGISTGADVSIAYAAANPGMFLFAGSYSGSYFAGDWTALKGTALFVAYGNGELGPLDDGHVSPYDETGGTERACAVGSAEFVMRLAELMIPVTVYDYGNGTHNAPYWQRDFERSFPLILKALGL
jgi:S-formylglutathione hydrolase FrmB